MPNSDNEEEEENSEGSNILSEKSNSSPSLKKNIIKTQVPLIKQPSEINLNNVDVIVITSNKSETYTNALQVPLMDSLNIMQSVPSMEHIGRSLMNNNNNTIDINTSKKSSRKRRKSLERHLIASPDRQQDNMKRHNTLKFDDPRKIALIGCASAIMTYDEMGMISSFNPEALFLFHYASSDHVVGRHVSSLLCESYKEETGEDKIREYFGLADPEIYALITNKMYGGEQTGLHLLTNVNIALGGVDVSPEGSPVGSLTGTNASFTEQTSPIDNLNASTYSPLKSISSKVRAITSSGEAFTLKLVVRKVSEPIGIEIDSQDHKKEVFSFVATLFNMNSDNYDEFEQYLQELDEDTEVNSRQNISNFVFPHNSQHNEVKEISAKTEYSVELRPQQPLFIEMEELDLSVNPFDAGKSEWHEVARWSHGLEQNVVIDVDGEEDFSAAHLGSCSFHGFVELRKWMSKGSVLLDLPCVHINDVIDRMLRSLVRIKMLPQNLLAKTKEVILCHHHHTSTQKAIKKKRLRQSALAYVEEEEACDVLVGSVTFLPTPILGFVRLEKLCDLGDMTEEAHRNHVRYIFLLLGPPCNSGNLYREIGRAFAVMMSQGWFSNDIRHASSKLGVLKCIDHFLDKTIVVPKPTEVDDEEYDVDLENERADIFSCFANCCNLRKSYHSQLAREERGIRVNIPQYSRKYMKRQQIDQEATNLTLSDELNSIRLSFGDSDSPQNYFDGKNNFHVTKGDFLCTAFLMLISVVFFAMCFIDKGSTNKLLNNLSISAPSISTFNGNLNAVVLNREYIVNLKNDCIPGKCDRSFFILKIIASTVDSANEGSYLYWQLLQNNTSQLSDIGLITLSTESQTEIDMVVKVNDIGISPADVLSYSISTNSTKPVAFFSQVIPLGKVGYFNSWFCIIMFLLIWICMVFGFLHRTVTVLVGSVIATFYLNLVVMGSTSHFVVSFFPEPEIIILLFSLMIIAEVVSSTGVVEYIIINYLVKWSSNKQYKLLMLLCLSASICSSILNNVTTLMIFTPIILELCKGIKINPVPFLISCSIFSNIGGTATMIGSPSNILIGTILPDFSFTDFLVYVFPCVIFLVPLVMVNVYLMLGKNFYEQSFNENDVEVLKSKYNIKKPKMLFRCALIMGFYILLLLLKPLHNIQISYLSLTAACSLLIISKPNDVHGYFELVEWDTLLFFVFIFIMVDAFNQLGFSSSVSQEIDILIQTLPPGLFAIEILSLIVLWMSIFASVIIDNILYTSLAVYIVSSIGNLSSLGGHMKYLGMVLSLGAGIGGTGSLYSSGGNLVVLSLAEHKNVEITFKGFCSFGMTTCIICTLFASCYIFLVIFISYVPS